MEKYVLGIQGIDEYIDMVKLKALGVINGI